MAKGENQKLKLMYLAKLFREKTDEEHGVTLEDMRLWLERSTLQSVWIYM